MKKALAIISLIAITSLYFIGCSTDKSSKVSNGKYYLQKSAKSEEEPLKLELYFDSSTSTGGVSVGKEERLLDRQEVIGELIVGELLKGPSVKSNLKAVFPKDVKLISFSIKEKMAIVNFSPEIQSNMEPLKEEICLKAISASLSQLSGIDKILIQVDSKSIKTIGGNYDISKPILKGQNEFTKIQVK
ncbi:Sporulation and spore germination [Hathewaya proteolytica DSM 3090]|uniref:Sporulation and spore germination n=1 Tax=Hathewaya proteolytica DSM 3090 TaxID=1121331 RepID=A0A1M6MTC6_9CLOT|nr:GerMN domain-containing protein [Hathewaya proteolytica]SHJ86768.1 Sporulation and spore germination [Hathewaya proteolytica DSM 3090]